MNKFVWYDLMTPNEKSVIAFYEQVVGWKIADSGMPGMNYNIIKADDIMVGGITSLPPQQSGMRPPWHGYVWSPDVDADARRVVAEGGKVHLQPADIQGVGRFAVVSDPGGASFILFKPSSTEQPAPVAPATPGHIGWRELHAADLEKAWSFYVKLFGWKKAEDMPMGALGAYRIFTCGDEERAGGMMTKMKDMPQPMWVYYFNVSGTATAAAERVSKAGGKRLIGPQEVPGGQWIVQAIDPEGHIFGLLAQKQ